MTNRQIADALLSLCPEAEWTLVGNSYENIDWLSNHPKPTKAQVEAEIAKEPQIAAAKAAAKTALLERLGITADEAALLLS
jgi:hypothetical protein